ncbi:MAG: hypothetical protein JWO95_1897 [Verrucomicrobiales bacterium]|nr:hypothetical protein [Verrucomicrobiales bacterium]
MGNKKQKVLLLGADGYSRTRDDVRVECFTWDKLFRIENLRDYDGLLLNLIPLSDEVARAKVDWKRFHALLDFCAASDILQHNGTIVVLGDPRFDIPPLTGSQDVPFLDWTGAFFRWDSQPGDTIEVNSASDVFSGYVRHLHRWTYSLEKCELNRSVFATKWNIGALTEKGWTPSVKVYSACKNRYNHPLAFSIQHEIVDEYDRSKANYGAIRLLPQIQTTESDTVQLILRDFFGVECDLAEPQWVSDYVAPGQDEIDKRVLQIQGAIKTNISELESTQKQREKARLSLKLLYEREFALEPIVRDVLKRLGAEVEDPIEKNKEDGWMKVTARGITYEGVLEIKSTNSDQFNEEGRKQLLDWIDRGRTTRHKNYKGIFIGNSAVTKPLNDRTLPFGDSWRKAAELSHICAFQSAQLYEVYVLNEQGKIDIADFWEKVFTTNGVLDMQQFVAKKETY